MYLFVIKVTPNKTLNRKNGVFELKIPAAISAEKSIDQYEEMTDEIAIKKHLKLDDERSLKEGLIESGFSPFCEITTKREKYKKDELSIDIDVVTAEDFYYAAAEVELLVEKNTDMEKGLDQIHQFMIQNNIPDLPVGGKVIEFLKQQKPEHYSTLISSGVIKGATA